MRLERRGTYFKDTEALVPFFQQKVDRGSASPGADASGCLGRQDAGEEDGLNSNNMEGMVRMGETVTARQYQQPPPTGAEEEKLTFAYIKTHLVRVGEVDHVLGVDTQAVEGIKTMHSIKQGSSVDEAGVSEPCEVRQKAGPLTELSISSGQEVELNELSCYCAGCVDGRVCVAPAGTRPQSTLRIVRPRHTMAGDHEHAQKALAALGKPVMASCKKGNLIAVYVPHKYRFETADRHKRMWGRGKLTIAEVVEVPKSYKRKGTSRRPDQDSQVKVYIPYEEREWERYVFRQDGLCEDEDGLAIAVERCKKAECPKRHCELIPIDHVRAGPWKWSEVHQVGLESTTHFDGAAAGGGGGPSEHRGSSVLRERAERACTSVCLGQLRAPERSISPLECGRSSFE